MSAVFRSYLWKEWREQRKTLGMLALGLLLASGMILAGLEWAEYDPSLVYAWTTTLCVCGVMLTVGTDLFARERQAGQLHFLQRIPAGLKTAFRAKLTFFGLVLAGAAAYGLLLGVLSGLTFENGVPAVKTGVLFWQFAALLLTAALWIFAVSTWVPSSVIATPVAVLFLLGICFPVWMVVHFTGLKIGHMGSAWQFRFPALVIWPPLACLAVGALFAARMSFVQAAKHSRPRTFGVLFCVASGVLFFSPIYAWSGVVLSKWMNRPYRILDAYIADGGDAAFVNVERCDIYGSGKLQSRSAILLELDSLDWSRVGMAGSTAFSSLEFSRSLAAAKGPTRVVDYDRRTGDPGQEFDAITGFLIGPATIVSEPSTDLQPSDFGLDSWPGEPRVRYFDFGSVVRFDSSSGGAESLGKWKDRVLFRTNDGLHLLEWSRELRYQIRILQSGFLFRDKDAWCRVDPETGAFESFAPLQSWEKLLVLLSDGRLLVLGEGQLILVDPATGDRHQMTMSGPLGSANSLRSFRSDSGGRVYGFPRAADEPLVAVLSPEFHNRFRPSRLALLDFDKNTVQLQAANAGNYQRIAWSNGAHAIVIEDWQRLVEVHLDTNERRVLLDASDL